MRVAKRKIPLLQQGGSAMGGYRLLHPSRRAEIFWLWGGRYGGPNPLVYPTFLPIELGLPPYKRRKTTRTYSMCLPDGWQICLCSLTISTIQLTRPVAMSYRKRRVTILHSHLATELPHLTSTRPVLHCGTTKSTGRYLSKEWQRRVSHPSLARSSEGGLAAN